MNHPVADVVDTAAPEAAARRRADIQGLRAVAVLLVIAFHAGLPVPGGFTGVDIFFVISGYVITSMLSREWQAHGRIRFRRFYGRRFKRLTPALAATVAVTVVLSSLLQSPLGPQQTTAVTALGAMLLCANVVISSTTGDYFDAPAGTNPLLNTWSLSVEEQFYLVFPFLLAMGWLVARRSWRMRGAPMAMVGAVGLASFLMALVGTYVGVGPRSAWLLGFYGPASRAWEFAAGAALSLALARLPRVPRRSGMALGAIGLALVCAGAVLINDSTPYPGFWTLLPVVGTMLLIAIGTDPTQPITRLLGRRPLVAVGNWSYSLYLWHWPLIVFAILVWPTTPWIAAAAASLSLVPALASYRWVEGPIRALQQLTARRWIALVSVVVGVPLLLSGGLLVSSQAYWTPRYAADEVPVVHPGDIGQDQFQQYLAPYSHPCAVPDGFPAALMPQLRASCRQSIPDRPIDVAIIGDSHAEELLPGLAEANPHRNIAFLDAPGLAAAGQPEADWIPQLLDRSPSLEAVLVDLFWSYRGVDVDEVRSTMTSLANRGVPVFVTDDTPDFPFDPFRCKYTGGLLLDARCTGDVEAALDSHDAAARALSAAVDGLTGVSLLQTWRYFCEDRTCSMTADGTLQYRDPNHLNVNGIRRLVDRLAADYPEFTQAVAGVGTTRPSRAPSSGEVATSPSTSASP